MSLVRHVFHKKERTYAIPMLAIKLKLGGEKNCRCAWDRTRFFTRSEKGEKNKRRRTNPSGADGVWSSKRTQFV
jgi:hypothetical protein